MTCHKQQTTDTIYANPYFERRTYRKWFFIFIFFMSAFPVFFPQSCDAQQAGKNRISVSPTILNISLSPGKTYEYTIVIKNYSNQALPLSAQLEPLFSPEDKKSQPNYTQSIISWITLSNPDLLIPPLTDRQLHFSVTVPDKVGVGGYYAIMYLSPLIKEKNPSTEIRTRIGILILSSIGVQEIPMNKVEISNLKTSRFIYDSDKPAIHFSVKNMALNHFSAKPFIRLKPLIGKEHYNEVEEKFVFPGKSRSWIFTQSAPLGYNVYQGTLFVSVGGGAQKTDTFTFIVLPYKLFIGVILGIMILVIVKSRRKKIVDALRILIKG